MYNLEQQHRDNLIEKSVCNRCNKKMQEVKMSIKQMPFDYIKLLLKNRLKYLIVRCPKCYSQGMHLYK